MPSCPHCGFTVDPDARTCPLCGSPIGGDAVPEAGSESAAGGPGGRTADAGGAAAPTPRGAAGPGGAGSARANAAGGLAWEDPERPFLASLFDAWKTSLLEPSRFFRSVSWEGSLGRPLLYFLLVFATAALFSAVWQAAWMDQFAREWMHAWGGAGASSFDFSTDGVLLRFFLSPFYGLLMLAVATVVFHVFVLVLVRERRTIGATARAMCYSMGPAVLSIVPIVGPLAAWFVWIPILQVIGLREAHRTTTGRAMAVWLAPAVLFLLAVLALAFLVVMMMGQYGGASGVLRRI